MMCKEFVLPGFDRPVFFHHHEDWSGLAVIEWWAETYHRVEIPARIILMLSFPETKNWILSQLINALETELNQGRTKP